MPVLTMVLFGFNIYISSTPYTSVETKRGAAYTNICETSDNFSHALFTMFFVV